MNPKRLLLGLALVLACPLHAALKQGDKPNVLFIAVDDLNDWIGVLGGNPQSRTPNIDRLARSGVLFRNAHCAAPACNPSRAALMSGLRPSTTGVYLNSQPWRPAMPDGVTLSQHFMQNGYYASGAGKIFHGRYDEDASWHDYMKKGGDPKPASAVLKDPHSKAGGIVWGVLDVADTEMNDYRVVSHTIEQLKKKQEKPFFLACGIFRPHMPWQVPRKYYDLYPLDSIQLPEVPEDDLLDLPSAGRKMAKPEGDHAKILETDNWKYAVQAYLASIAFTDAQIGRLLDGLDQSPYKENTIVVFWTDHGWHLGEKQHWRKFALWEEATRTPLVILAPGVTRAGTESTRPVSLLDLYPTLIELCGIENRSELEGRSIVPLLKNPKAAWDHSVVTTHGRNNHAVRSEHFRYIRYADGSEELYDHRTDPREYRNRADDAALAELKAGLKKVLPKRNVPDAETDPALKKGSGKSGKNANKKKKQK